MLDRLPSSSACFYYFWADLHRWFFMYLVVTLLSHSCLHMLFSNGLSILYFICILLTTLAWSAINGDSISVFRYLILTITYVVSTVIPSIYHLQCPYYFLSFAVLFPRFCFFFAVRSHLNSSWVILFAVILNCIPFNQSVHWFFFCPVFERPFISHNSNFLVFVPFINFLLRTPVSNIYLASSEVLVVLFCHYIHSPHICFQNNQCSAAFSLWNPW